MPNLYKDASGNLLLSPSDPTTLMSGDADCCCEEVCCTECTLTDQVNVTAPAGNNVPCSLQGATLTDQTLDCVDDVRGGTWPIPSGTNYFYGNCPSNITSYKLVIWCVDGSPAAFLWDPFNEVVAGEYTLISCTGDPLEWVFQGGSMNGWACADCAEYIIVTL